MLGVITFPTVPATYIVGNLVGGLIFGVGMALAGFCPGTCAAGAGEGKLDYLIPGLLGFLTGAVHLRPDLRQGLPSDLQAAELRQRRHPRPVERQSHPGRRASSPLMALLLFYLIDRMGWQRKPKAD